MKIRIETFDQHNKNWICETSVTKTKTGKFSAKTQKAFDSLIYHLGQKNGIYSMIKKIEK